MEKESGGLYVSLADHAFAVPRNVNIVFQLYSVEQTEAKENRRFSLNIMSSGRQKEIDPSKGGGYDLLLSF